MRKAKGPLWFLPYVPEISVWSHTCRFTLWIASNVTKISCDQLSFSKDCHLVISATMTEQCGLGNLCSVHSPGGWEFQDGRAAGSEHPCTHGTVGQREQEKGPHSSYEQESTPELMPFIYLLLLKVPTPTLLCWGFHFHHVPYGGHIQCTADWMESNHLCV